MPRTGFGTDYLTDPIKSRYMKYWLLDLKRGTDTRSRSYEPSKSRTDGGMAEFGTRAMTISKAIPATKISDVMDGRSNRKMRLGDVSMRR